MLELPAGTVTCTGIVTRFGLLKTSFETTTVTGLAATLFSRTVPVATDRNATFVGATVTPATTVALVVVPPPPPPPPLPLEARVAAGVTSRTAPTANKIFQLLLTTTPYLVAP